MNISRNEALALLHEYVQSESLRRHCLAVEAAMRAYAKKYNEDADEWGICGLLHDFDFEKYPSVPSHPIEGSKILREKGYPENIITAILGHASHTDTPRESQMAKCLFAVDELCGFLTALAHIRPDNFSGMSVASVEKNLKKKGFAAKINRGEIDRGIEELGVPRAEHIELTIKALQGVFKELGF
ncbi:MAG: Metal dependent phosphohydrolase [Candidatus Jorgensenbacteria bacterium GW2011_GWA1_48_11]|uniref:Metal dependent phosphohydrolase n=1 Tax=Candidatus Jorgensenbacteria bacterium GW2011_GWA1_48_11 TaxID=1618660 RepID=A0A0G1UAH8_9BACT|nr:MAG: Metal dependent phosphohydrolase [Candidatus Jorgensenbacteria bacterium GW2011_GWA1_48_11]KKW11862.1 MAG: Metal dependent phosphohydrolase [Candidatus Jorgensenbacteria bacterium GW2011_GWB1_49_9]